jgi:glycosyltransferase involved in cell wall biosynthesis
MISPLFLPEFTHRFSRRADIKRSIVSVDNDLPLLSIVTEVMNGADHIQQTIDSVTSQDYDNVEYIVVDGGSTDETLNIIEANREKISHIISEPDRGIYDAINKGIRFAHGDIVGIIASNDWYNEDIFGHIIEEYKKNPHAIIYGIVKIYMNERFCGIEGHPVEWLRNGMFPHSTVFVPREVYLEHGTYDITYRIAADYDAMIRYWKANVPFSFCDRVLANVRVGGISSSPLSAIEQKSVMKKHGFIAENHENMSRRLLKKAFNSSVDWIRDKF